MSEAKHLAPNRFKASLTILAPIRSAADLVAPIRQHVKFADAIVSVPNPENRTKPMLRFVGKPASLDILVRQILVSDETAAAVKSALRQLNAEDTAESAQWGYSYDSASITGGDFLNSIVPVPPPGTVYYALVLSGVDHAIPTALKWCDPSWIVGAAQCSVEYETHRGGRFRGYDRWLLGSVRANSSSHVLSSLSDMLEKGKILPDRYDLIDGWIKEIVQHSNRLRSAKAEKI